MSKQPNFKHYTRGGQTSFHNLRMWDQITKTLTLISLFFWIILTGLLVFIVIPAEKLQQMLVYYAALFFNQIGFQHTFSLPFHGKTYPQSVQTLLHYPYYANNAKQMLALFGQITLAAFGLALFVSLGLAFYFVKKGKTQSANQFVRGSKFEPQEQLKQRIIAERTNSDITIDGFPLIAGSEVQHMLVHGTVGTGKSQLIMKILDVLRARGDRVIVYDKGCAFLPYYYREKSDIILNPFDKRCPNWDLWLEAPTDADFENMAEALISLQGESDPFWVNAARTVFASTASRMRTEKDRSVEKLLKLLLTSDFSSLEHYLQGTPAATLISGKIEKTALSIRATITTYLKSLLALSGLSDKKSPSFSIRDYLLDEHQRGWLFISSNGESHKTLKPLISMWLAMASLTLLSLPPDKDRRIWFICDELPSLNRLPLLGETIAEARKFGGCFLLGMQSHSQLTKVYGQSGAKEIFDLLNTRFFFRSPSSDMARLVSNELGEEDIEEARENYSYGANSIRDGISLGSQRVTRPIVAYPEILELPNLTCFLRLPGNYPVTQLKLILSDRFASEAGVIKREQTALFDHLYALDFGNVSGQKAEKRTSMDMDTQAGNQAVIDKLIEELYFDSV